MEIPEHLYADVNPVMMDKVFSNLLLNAIRYTPEEKGNHIRVLLKPGTDTETVYCQIENTGVFIPEEALVHLFEAFYRVEQSRNRQTGGSGLGLYIVKMILDQHGASYRMGNTCDGVCFSFLYKITQRITYKLQLHYKIQWYGMDIIKNVKELDVQ